MNNKNNKAEFEFWTSEFINGTINSAIDQNPTAAVRFFGSIAVLSRDEQLIKARLGVRTLTRGEGWIVR